MRVNGLGQSLDVLAMQLDPLTNRNNETGGLWTAFENTVYDWTGGLFGRAPAGIIPPPSANPPVAITAPYYCAPPLVWDSYLAGCVSPNQVPSMSTQLGDRTAERQRAINQGYKVGSESASMINRALGIEDALDAGKVNWPIVAALALGSVLLIKRAGNRGRRRRR